MFNIIDSCAYNAISEICQIRLDFSNFNIAQPTAAATGLCVDTLVITPGALPATNNNILPPTLCGNQLGQHGMCYAKLLFSANIVNLNPFFDNNYDKYPILVYVDAGTANTVATLDFTTATSGTGTWRVS